MNRHLGRDAFGKARQSGRAGDADERCSARGPLAGALQSARRMPLRGFCLQAVLQLSGQSRKVSHTIQYFPNVEKSSVDTLKNATFVKNLRPDFHKLSHFSHFFQKNT